MIHGLVDRPLTFTMEDLKRLPSLSRLHFIECAGNRHNGRSKTSCAEWTGVLLSKAAQHGLLPKAPRK